MLTKHEEQFVDYWKQNRDKEKKLFRQLLIGLPLGLIMGIGIIASVLTGGWYTRAIMVANTEMNPGVIIIAVLAIVVFIAIFYKKFKWEQNEQQYQELLNKMKKKPEADK